MNRSIKPEYELFLRKNKNEKEKSFIKWFCDNENIGGDSLLRVVQTKNMMSSEEYGDVGQIMKDPFLKKLVLINNIIQNKMNQLEYCSTIDNMSYSNDTIYDAMNLYEDIIEFVVMSEHISVSSAPIFKYKNNVKTTISIRFNNLSEIKEKFIKNTTIYDFKILNDLTIEIRFIDLD